MPNDIEDIKNTLHDIKDSISIYRTSNLEIDYPMYGWFILFTVLYKIHLFRDVLPLVGI